MPPKPTRHLTHPSSPLASAPLATLLRTKPEAWALLPFATRQHLYTLLPSPPPGEPPHDPDVNPLETHCRPYIEEELRRWQEDLAEGREAKKWRAEALEAGRARRNGEFEEFRLAEREGWFGNGKGGGGEGEGEEGGDAP
ncbi:hypothetical protein K431DRAFT_297352 [Polychaeton citri CBS 116435]|uniref:ASX DEUBAD domain-containing protein n=1 Tax=Polychaeton citri CBS 116435 TaxID=1314669 RepID=A0A9P4ULL9_9PEZI|nr:hypothetical protein K431DRAFT_297352 [Polychaeton citri CBS 116435]